MKKLLALLAVALLAACTQSHHHKSHDHHHKGNEAHAKNLALAQAIKACNKAVKRKKDRAKFEACLKEKGFEQLANHPKMKGHH